MPRAEQTVAYSITPVVPTTAGKLPVFSTTGNPAKATDSVFGQADAGHQIIAGIGAAVNAAQVATKPAVVIGELASAWGDRAVAIGYSSIAGQNAARDGSIAIGNSRTADSKNKITIGSGLAFGASQFDDSIEIGTQAVASRIGVCIGAAASQAGQNGIAIGPSSNAGEGSSIAIGRGAACTNSGLGTPNKNVAIGDGAACNPSFASSAGGVIAIGTGATNNSQNGTAIGPSASVSGVNVVNAIALGAFAVASISNDFVVGDTTNAPVNKVKVRTAAATALRHLVGASGAFVIQALDAVTDLLQVDTDATAGNVRLMVYDVTAAALKRVSLGAADSGAVGFKLLRVPN